MADLPPLPGPYKKAVFATNSNTASVRFGCELGGYEKTPALYTAEQMRAYGTACAEHAESATAARCAEIAESWATAETAATCANIADAIRRHYGLRERADG